MNLGDVKTRVKRQFGDESAVQISDDDIARWVNDAQRFIVSNNDDLLQNIETLDTTANIQSYALPGDIMTLRSISYQHPNSDTSYYSLKGYSPQEFSNYVDGWDGNNYGAGKPAIFMIFSNTLSLFPIPDTGGTATLKIYYNRLPTDLISDDDNIDLPVAYFNTVVDYCLKQAYELDEDWWGSSMKSQQIASDMRISRGLTNGRDQGTYPVITILPDDQW